ncbi:MAG TPA: GNAT family acetyltransferase [Patescibacteria group bacterium]|nr:GNAT family acetyltransferase [Patescibacteria group bacterium]
MGVIERATSGGQIAQVGATGAMPRLQAAFLEAHRHGVGRATYGLALKTLNRVMPIKILRGVIIERPRPEFLVCPEGYEPAFLAPDLLRRFSLDPETRLSPGFVEEAVSKGDECFGILRNGRLATYGWYSSRPTRIDPPEMRLRFRYDYVYMYNGYTHPRDRGLRLHAIGMTLALREYLRRGRKGLVSYVESGNFDSLKSCRRMGYAEFGSIYIVRLSGRHRAFSSPGCRRIDFRVERATGTA